MTSPAPFPHFWADLKSPDFARLASGETIAVLPVAAIDPARYTPERFSR